VVFDQPIHDVTHVPDYPERTLRSGRRRRTWDGSIAGLERGRDGGGDALFVADDGEGVDYSPVAFSARLPGGIHLSQLPDPRSVREALEAPDAEWKEAMDRWVLHWEFMNGVLEINKASLVARGNQQRPGIDYDGSFSPVMRLESLCILLVVAAIIRTYDIVQFDITSAYLHRTQGQPSGFGHNLGRVHWEAAKRVLRYLKGTRRWRLVLGGKLAKVMGFAEADWGSDRDDRRSVGCVALSLTETGYVTLCQSAKESVWMEEFVKGLGVSVSSSMVIKVDNQGSIALANNSVSHDRLKHIDIQHHYTRDLVRANGIELKCIPPKDMVADVLTKALLRAQHKYLVKAVSLFWFLVGRTLDCSVGWSMW